MKDGQRATIGLSAGLFQQFVNGAGDRFEESHPGRIEFRHFSTQKKKLKIYFFFVKKKEDLKQRP